MANEDFLENLKKKMEASKKKIEEKQRADNAPPIDLGQEKSEDQEQVHAEKQKTDVPFFLKKGGKKGAIGSDFILPEKDVSEEFSTKGSGDSVGEFFSGTKKQVDSKPFQRRLDAKKKEDSEKRPVKQKPSVFGKKIFGKNIENKPEEKEEAEEETGEKEKVEQEEKQFETAKEDSEESKENAGDELKGMRKDDEFAQSSEDEDGDEKTESEKAGDSDEYADFEPLIVGDELERKKKLLVRDDEEEGLKSSKDEEHEDSEFKPSDFGEEVSEEELSEKKPGKWAVSDNKKVKKEEPKKEEKRKPVEKEKKEPEKPKAPKKSIFAAIRGFGGKKKVEGASLPASKQKKNSLLPELDSLKRKKEEKVAENQFLRSVQGGFFGSEKKEEVSPYEEQEETEASIAKDIFDNRVEKVQYRKVESSAMNTAIFVSILILVLMIAVLVFFVL